MGISFVLYFFFTVFSFVGFSKIKIKKNVHEFSSTFLLFSFFIFFFFFFTFVCYFFFWTQKSMNEVAKLNVAIHPCRLKGSRYTERTVFRFCRVQPTFWKWMILGILEGILSIQIRRGKIQFFTETFPSWIVIILVSMHTYFDVKHWEKSQSIEDNMAIASIGP